MTDHAAIIAQKALRRPSSLTPAHPITGCATERKVLNRDCRPALPPTPPHTGVGRHLLDARRVPKLGNTVKAPRVRPIGVVPSPRSADRGSVEYLSR
jgi:hypothetical protein